MQDFSLIKMKDDHEKRPMWISHDGRLFIEAFSPKYKEVTDFMIAIAEPVSRPSFIHEYALTPYSLYAAASVGFYQEEIFVALDKYSKNLEIPEVVKE